MKITKDLQNYLKIVSIIIQKNGMDYLCYLSRFNDGLLTFQIASPIYFEKSENITLQFNFKEATEYIEGMIKDFGENFLQVNLTSPSLPNISNCLDKLNEMVVNDEKYGRRKEPRIKLGLKDYKKFFLTKQEQVLYSKCLNFMQPCILMDVSIHGVCVLTPFTTAIKKHENFKINISFTKPEESIIIDVHKIYVNIKRDNNKEYAIISCQLLEPIHFNWKNRIIKIIK